ncbi:MAG: hypothetical protein IJN67_05895 [Oscillospiraceae bacterium]|nr:hypothetical protein [Oscillospiraceae bacterium]
MNPYMSPWGKIDWMETLAPGIDMIGAEGHGGIMVSREASFMLTPTARKYGHWQGGYLCFEAHAEENIVLRELLDQKLWHIPDRIKDLKGFEADIDQRIQSGFPEYWKSREKRRAFNAKRSRSRSTIPNR